MPANTRTLQALARLSDRAMARTVGTNTYLRGRVYARRGAVEDLDDSTAIISARVTGRADESYDVKVEVDDASAFRSHCSCAAWRGPDRHCKHVAAVMLIAREKVRPKEQAAAAQAAAQAAARAAREAAAAAEAANAQGKRRRARRGRRGRTDEAPRAPEVTHRGAPSAAVAIPQTAPATGRAGFEVWLPADVPTRAPEIEYRLLVRSASLSVTPVLVASRTQVAPVDALLMLGTATTPHRPLLRALARLGTRAPHAPLVEARGEDAADVLRLMNGRRVLLEPASIELRFSDEPLYPRIELEPAPPSHVRVRVAFERRNDGRKFSLGSGAWFEGTPAFHVDTTEGVVRPLADVLTPPWLHRFFRAPTIVHPIDDLARLLGELVPRVAVELAAPLPDISSTVDVVDVAPTFQLVAHGDVVEVHAALRASYAGVELPIPPDGLPPPLAVLPAGDPKERPRCIRRDIGAEREAVETLRRLGFVIEPDEESKPELVARGDAAVTFWTEGIGTLPETWDRFIPADLVDVTVRNSRVGARARVSSGVDWLSLDVSFEADGIAVPESELRLALAEGRKLVKLSDGTYAPASREELEQVLEKMTEIFANGGRGGNKIALSQAGRVQALLTMVGATQVHRTARDVFEQLNDIGHIPNVEVPAKLSNVQLREYQKRGFSWLVYIDQIGTGGVLADDMGLGKTVQTIALLLHAKQEAITHAQRIRPTLVVCPTSVVPNWMRELERFAPSLRVVAWSGGDRKGRKHELEDADVIITSYALLRRDEAMLQEMELGYAVLDEAQNIKNPLSATARAAKGLNAQRRLALTGTPIENRLSEIWSIFDFVSPGMLGDLASFEERYARPIDRGEQRVIEDLRGAIHPFVLRRIKQEVEKDLPAKIVSEQLVPMTPAQGRLYRQMLREVRENLRGDLARVGFARAQIQILAALTRLRQAACDPRLLGLAGDFSDEDSGKLVALRELLQAAMAGGHRVLVFSQFVQMLTRIRAALESDGIAYEYLDGSTVDRAERVQRFNEDDRIPVFLISLKAGGTGLNLTGADTVVHFDPWWNPAVEDQATDRAHRIGQTRVVTAYRLVARGTIEEKILLLSERKRTLVASVLSTDGESGQKLSEQDLDELLSEEGLGSELEEERVQVVIRRRDGDAPSGVVALPDDASSETQQAVAIASEPAVAAASSAAAAAPAAPDKPRRRRVTVPAPPPEELVAEAADVGPAETADAVKPKPRAKAKRAKADADAVEPSSERSAAVAEAATPEPIASGVVRRVRVRKAAGANGGASEAPPVEAPSPEREAPSTASSSGDARAARRPAARRSKSTPAPAEDV